MQNQLQYPSNFSSQPPSNQAINLKFNSPSQLKSFDKSLPAASIKHYSSNPNLSLEMNNQKPPNFPNDSSTHSSNTLKKANDFRSPPSHIQYNYNQNPAAQRPLRS